MAGCSMGVKWLVLVLTTAMALDHLGIGGKIVDLAFAILLRMVLALALAVGLGSKDLVPFAGAADNGRERRTVPSSLIYSEPVSPRELRAKIPIFSSPPSSTRAATSGTPPTRRPTPESS